MVNLLNKYLYAKGTCNVVVRNITTGDVDYQSNKMQTSQFATTCDMGAIQAGIGNATVIQIPHNSAVNLTLTAADFSMNARAMSVGSTVAYGGISPVCEVITAGATALTVTNTPAAPYGYTVNRHKEFEVVPTEADIVRRIFDHYNNDGWGYKKIANFQFTKDRAVTKRSCLPIPPQQGVRLYRQGVGWAVYFVNGCLAIPLVR